MTQAMRTNISLTEIKIAKLLKSAQELNKLFNLTGKDHYRKQAEQKEQRAHWLKDEIRIVK